MRKQLAAAIACLLVLGLGNTAYADGDNIGITITDITPREEQNSETQNAYAAGGYFPLQIQTAEDEGVRLLIKTFVVPQGTSPQALIEEGLTRRGVEYQVSDVLRQELEGSSESRQVSQTVTIPSETDETDKLLALLEPSISYNEDGYTGTLTLDRDSVRTEVSDTTGYSYTTPITSRKRRRKTASPSGWRIFSGPPRTADWTARAFPPGTMPPPFTPAPAMAPGQRVIW